MNCEEYVIKECEQLKKDCAHLRFNLNIKSDLYESMRADLFNLLNYIVYKEDSVNNKKYELSILEKYDKEAFVRINSIFKKYIPCDTEKTESPIIDQLNEAVEKC